MHSLPLDNPELPFLSWRMKIAWMLILAFTMTGINQPVRGHDRSAFAIWRTSESSANTSPSAIEKRCDPQVTSCLHNVSAHINFARSESEKMCSFRGHGQFPCEK